MNDLLNQSKNSLNNSSSQGQLNISDITFGRLNSMDVSNYVSSQTNLNNNYDAKVSLNQF